MTHRSLKKMISNDSGRYRIEHGELSYRSEVYGSWKLPISEITLIGEYTNEDGPMADDYFLLFLFSEEPGWFEASFYPPGGCARRLLWLATPAVRNPKRRMAAHSKTELRGHNPVGVGIDWWAVPG
ncbi:hypothetical protein BH23VER1_BH23VER1_09740 [soil metagenome]